MPTDVRAAIRAGQSTLGSFISVPSPHLVEMAAHAGFDFVVIDMEHGSIGIGEAESLVRAAQAAGITSVVRIAENRSRLIGQALDAGADGVLVPHVECAAEALAVVAAARFEPEGSRGLGLSVRAARYGTLGRERFLAHAPFLSVQIESVGAVERIAEIAAVPGIDLLFVGPSDLSASLGHPGEPEHSEVQAAIEGVKAAALAHGVPLGIFAGSASSSVEWVDRGFPFVLTGSTGIIQGALTGYVREFRSRRGLG
ncbi:MAG TPA: aldolase/citrate lyase family protein [Symbiobacteriaceae bacterium]|nr:aldolase/citrate lyase family protein [Symbiobacteriaceae bacterium]